MKTMKYIGIFAVTVMSQQMFGIALRDLKKVAAELKVSEADLQRRVPNWLSLTKEDIAKALASESAPASKAPEASSVRKEELRRPEASTRRPEASMTKAQVSMTVDQAVLEAKAGNLNDGQIAGLTLRIVNDSGVKPDTKWANNLD